MNLHVSDLNAFLLSCLLIYFLKQKAKTIGLIDVPDHRKTHEVSVPLVGGIAVFIAFSLSVLSNDLHSHSEFSLLAGGGVLMLEGALDDRYGFIAAPRFLAQVSAAGIMIIVGSIMVHNLGDLVFTGSVLLGHWAVPFTIFATVGVTNAFNMADGMDGLLGSLAVVALVALGIVAINGGQFVILRLIILLASAVLAFLMFNLRTPWRKRAAVFLGDAGSTFLGFAITWFIIRLSQGNEPAMPPVTALWILMVPLYDTVFVMCRRIAGGHSPFAADRGHLHHLLLEAGCGVSGTLTAIIGLAVAGAAVGLGGVMAGVSESVLFVTFLAGFLAYSCTVVLAWHCIALSRAQPSEPLSGWWGSLDSENAAYRSQEVSLSGQFDDRGET